MSEKEKKFEKSISKLEEIVNKLEEGNLDLDSAIKLYEEGVELSRFCQNKLNKTEQKVFVFSLDT